MVFVYSEKIHESNFMNVVLSNLLFSLAASYDETLLNKKDIWKCSFRRQNVLSANSNYESRRKSEKAREREKEEKKNVREERAERWENLVWQPTRLGYATVPCKIQPFRSKLYFWGRVGDAFFYLTLRNRWRKKFFLGRGEKQINLSLLNPAVHFTKYDRIHFDEANENRTHYGVIPCYHLQNPQFLCPMLTWKVSPS